MTSDTSDSCRWRLQFHPCSTSNATFSVLLSSWYDSGMNHGPSQQSSKEGYEPWKLCATAKDYASHTKIQQAIGPHEDLLTIVKRRKRKWYGHVPRSSGLTKGILQGSVKGGRRQGRQKKRGGKTTSGNGRTWSSPGLRGQWRTEKMEETG